MLLCVLPYTWSTSHATKSAVTCCVHALQSFHLIAQFGASSRSEVCMNGKQIRCLLPAYCKKEADSCSVSLFLLLEGENENVL